MKQANQGFKSKSADQHARAKSSSPKSTGQPRRKKVGPNQVVPNKIGPLGSTQVVLPSTSKTKLNKQNPMGTKKKNNSIQLNETRSAKHHTSRERPEQRRPQFKNKELLEQEDIDDKLLRDDLRRDMAGKNPYDTDNAMVGKKNVNWSPTYENVRREMISDETSGGAGSRNGKGTDLKIVESLRKSAWVDGRENNLLRPSSSEKSVQAWILTDLEDNPERPTSIKVNGPTKTQLDESLDDGSGFDTDLEDDAAGRRSHFDRSSEEIYEKICKKKGIVPVSYIMKRLSDTEILVPHHGLGPEGAKALTYALLVNISVETLDLSDNDLQPEGGIAFACMLHENIYITDLNLSENFLHAPAGIAISKALAVNTTIKRLSLRGNHLTDKVAVAMAETLKENRTLAELDLSYNDFGETGGLYLGAGLSLNYGLKKLNLKWNAISGKGAISIAHALGTNESLTNLDVSWNGFAYTGSMALSTNLPANDCLKHLDLRNNHIRDDAVRKLVPVFAQHPHLVEIKLGMNPIGPGGIEAIFDAVMENPRIKHVGLEDISIPVKLMPLIEELKQERGVVVISDKQTMKSVPETKKAGLEILMEFLEENALRLRDMFYQFDKDHSGDITRQEFKTGLKEMGILMDPKQLDTLITEMDKDKNGIIDYSEILGGHKMARQNKRRQTLAILKSQRRDTAALVMPELDTIKSNLAFREK